MARRCSLDGRPGRARARDQAPLAKDGLTWGRSPRVWRSQHPRCCGSSAANSGEGPHSSKWGFSAAVRSPALVLGNLISLLALSGAAALSFPAPSARRWPLPSGRRAPAAAAHARSPRRRAARRAARAPSRGRRHGSGRWARIVRRGHDRVRVDARSALRRPGRRPGGGGRRRRRGADRDQRRLSSVPRRQHKAGSASAISETAYELGTGLGIAILGSVLSALYVSALPTGLPGESLAETLAAAPSTAAAATAASTSRSHRPPRPDSWRLLRYSRQVLRSPQQAGRPWLLNRPSAAWLLVS